MEWLQLAEYWHWWVLGVVLVILEVFSPGVFFLWLGIAAGLVAIALPGVVIAGGALLAMGLAGAGMGAWLGGMIGMDVENTHIKQFESAIQEGQILVLVDVPKDRVDDIQSSVKKHHSDADFEGTEPTIPAFP